MALTPDQEREYLAELDRMGVSLVRSEFERKQIPPHLLQLTGTWLSAKDREAEARRAASGTEQIELMRIASQAAERATAAAERQATASEKANTRATLALIIASISFVATVIGIWITHLDVHK
jgi:hypothetical protein